MSLTDYADLPSITQYERRSDRENSFAQDRMRPESPFYSPRANETFRKNRPSRHSMETPCIHVDPSRVVRSYPESRHTVEFESPSRVPAPDSYRDEDLLRHPSTQVQDTYTETSSTRSARRRPRSPQYETPRRVGAGRDMGPARETTRASGTGESAANDLAALIGVLQAPKVDLPTFKGDPMQYHTFMRAFDDNVGRTISDPSSKLARLMQLCTGEAARVIQGCTLMSPERGYVRARQLLKDRYGAEYESLNALEALDELQTQGNLSEIIKKLPGYLQNKWRDIVRRLKVHEHRQPDLQDVVEYVEEAAAVASDPVYGNQKSERSSAPTRVAYVTSNSSPCLVCEREGHEVLSCEKFIALRPEDRLQAAVRLRLCFVCLRGGHITRDCTSKMRCKAESCGRMHATMLHAANWSKLREQGRRRRERAVSDHNREAPAEETPTTGSVYDAQGKEDSPGDTNSTQDSKVALPLVPVRVYSPESKRNHSTYALLDTGSNVTLCHERLLQTLGIQGRPETMSLTTLDKKRNRMPTRVISLDVTDPDGEERLHLGQVYTRDSLPIDPRNRVTMSEAARWSHLKGLPLHHAPIDEVMLLIGQDYPDALIPLATVSGRRGEPYAVRTRLGWTVNGPVNNSETRGEQQAFFTQGERYERLDQQVERFWKLESGGIYDDSRAMSVQDELVTTRWEKTAMYEDGHYTLPIPFRHEDPQLPDNKQMAELRLRSLRRKLEKNPELSEKYTEGMEDLLSKGYAVEVPQSEVERQDGKVWYLPHHPVVNPNKEKPRIVFDCAAQHRGVSLNSKVLQGPDLTNKLVGVLTRFRLHQVALMADVEAMFHQVRVKTDDQDTLRFLWWPQGRRSEAPRAYRMTVHLFGGTWSPSCCTYAMHRTVQDHEHQFSESACETVRRNF